MQNCIEGIFISNKAELFEIELFWHLTELFWYLSVNENYTYAKLLEI